MDAKGQIVLPKDLREKANIKPNEKLAVVACEKEGEVCCIMLLKAERFGSAVTKTVAPLIKSLTKEEIKYERRKRKERSKKTLCKSS